MDKKALSERDVCTKYITPAVVAGGWDVQAQIANPRHRDYGYTPDWVDFLVTKLSDQAEYEALVTKRV